MRDIKSVLVYTGMELLGDGVMKIPFIRAIRQAFPDAQITWMTGHGKTVFNSSLAPLVKKDLAEIIEETFLGYHWQHFFRLPEPWAHRHFDLILDTQSKKFRTLVLRQIPHQYFVSRSWKWLLSDVRPHRSYQYPPHLVNRLIDMVAFAAGHPLHPDTHLTIPESYLQQAKELLPEGKPYLGLSPGAGQVKKCWPLANYIELGKFFSAQGLCPTFILGPSEHEWQFQIQQALPEAFFPLQQTSEKSPLLTMALARRMKAIVANDSGVGHLLAAGENPILTLFGPTSAECYAPQTPHGGVLRSRDVGKGRDIATIPVSHVMATVNNMLREKL